MYFQRKTIWLSIDSKSSRPEVTFVTSNEPCSRIHGPLRATGLLQNCWQVFVARLPRMNLTVVFSSFDVSFFPTRVSLGDLVSARTYYKSINETSGTGNARLYSDFKITVPWEIGYRRQILRGTGPYLQDRIFRTGSVFLSYRVLFFFNYF